MQPARRIFPRRCLSALPLGWLLFAGCATPPRTVESPPPPPVLLPAAAETRAVETPYAVRAYRDAWNPTLRHEAHTVYRRTRVPVATDFDGETGPRAVYPPATYQPLEGADELAAELATQQAITAELHAIRAAMRETEARMQLAYATLARQAAQAKRAAADAAPAEVAPAAVPADRANRNDTTEPPGAADGPSELDW